MERIKILQLSNESAENKFRKSVEFRANLKSGMESRPLKDAADAMFGLAAKIYENTLKILEGRI